MKRHHPLLLLILSISTFFGSASAEDFVFNGFNSSDMLLYGVADIESRVLTLTNQTSFAIGRALYPSKIPAKSPNSSDVVPFSTSFIFSIAPYEDILPGHGIVFLFAPVTGIEGATSSQHLGFLNRTNDGNSTNHVFGVKFDVFKNEEFGDISDNHVGINVNSLTSMSAHEAGYWPDNGKISSGGGNSSSEEDEKSFKRLQLNNGKNYQVWIDYMDFHINVTMAVAGKTRPQHPLLSVALNLSDVFLDDMYVGFTAATGRLVEIQRVHRRDHSGSFLLCSLLLRVFMVSDKMEASKSEKEGGNGRMGIGVLASQNHSSGNRGGNQWFLGGKCDWNWGNGKVYKGVLEGGAEIAVKRISHENDQGMREFVAEISSLGRLKHRCLVSLRGWCKRENGSFMLVYDYMENGSLDKRVFECEESKLLSFKDRIRVLKDVASGVLYLHEGWESKVLHRDIKASNVLLDRDMNGRLGDFGLARMHGHDKVGSTTRVVGTVGYLAPEVIRTGRASAQTDVFGFGVLILEVLCGRRPMEEGKQHLIDWVWELMMKGELVLALDERLRSRGELDEEEVEKVLHLGLLCTYPDPSARPTMRQVVKILEGGNEVCESEGEEMDAYLLESVRSKSMWSKYSHTFGRGSHPTFEDFRQSLASSMSMSWSDAILDGRLMPMFSKAFTILLADE
ncbi:putative L-type lectin-domain containing receptor kinase VII.2 [Vitis vinifera]|uniref:non-specific serine/threonine protein kinase n=1 Tax=Vitis vinifera TaxID=29760 RepID=A0A438DR49_VITVI|nr:putative L-type lectin-domain containing receptor kinase VII.2 [Vitis vinifera]